MSFKTKHEIFKGLTLKEEFLMESLLLFYGAVAFGMFVILLREGMKTELDRLAESHMSLDKYVKYSLKNKKEYIKLCKTFDLEVTLQKGFYHRDTLTTRVDVLISVYDKLKLLTAGQLQESPEVIDTLILSLDDIDYDDKKKRYVSDGSQNVHTGTLTKLGYTPTQLLENFDILLKLSSLVRTWTKTLTKQKQKNSFKSSNGGKMSRQQKQKLKASFIFLIEGMRSMLYDADNMLFDILKSEEYSDV